jgi:transposase, IS5 family
MIEPSRPQLSFAEGLIQEEVGPLWEQWMRQVDALLTDRQLVQIVYEALARRYPRSRTRGRPATPAEVVLRLLLLKHMRNWSYHVLEREVRANLVYRQFTRVGAEKVPDAKTLGRLALALGPEIIEQIHRRVIAIACEKGVERWLGFFGHSDKWTDCCTFPLWKEQIRCEDQDETTLPRSRRAWRWMPCGVRRP